MQLAKHIAQLIDNSSTETIDDIKGIADMLTKYAAVIEPWAKAVANAMLVDVERRDRKRWRDLAHELGWRLRHEVENAPTGDILHGLQSEQVELIKSLPLKAAQQIHEIAIDGISSGRRAEDLAEAIQKAKAVPAWRAALIARTETSRAAANFVQARAVFAGSTGYIWRSSEDGTVRPTHKKVNGHFFTWDNPPKTDENLDPYNPGCGPNCRCFAEPIFPRD